MNGSNHTDQIYSEAGGAGGPKRKKNGKRQMEVAGKYNNVPLMIPLNPREALSDGSPRGQRRHQDPELEGSWSKVTTLPLKRVLTLAAAVVFVLSPARLQT